MSSANEAPSRRSGGAPRLEGDPPLASGTELTNPRPAGRVHLMRDVGNASSGADCGTFGLRPRFRVPVPRDRALMPCAFRESRQRRARLDRGYVTSWLLAPPSSASSLAPPRGSRLGVRVRPMTSELSPERLRLTERDGRRVAVDRRTYESRARTIVDRRYEPCGVSQ